jgi:hypothetical protein
MPNYRKPEGFASHQGFGAFGPLAVLQLNGNGQPFGDQNVAHVFAASLARMSFSETAPIVASLIADIERELGRMPNAAA